MMHQGQETRKVIFSLWTEGYSFIQISAAVGLSKKEISRHVHEMRKAEKPKQITIMDLTYTSCRYVIGRDEELGSLFCGQKTYKRSYCPHHFQLCYVPIKSK